MQAQSGDKLSFDEKMFCLFKGDPGTAKSPAAASWPEPYFLDVEGRIISTVNYWRGIGGVPPYKKNVHFNYFINNYAGMMEKIDSLINYNPYGTVVMDGFTVLSRSLQTLIFQQRGSGAPKKAEDGKERVYRNVGAAGSFKGIPVMEIDDFNVENNGIVQTLDGLRALWRDGKGCHIICIGHVISVENKDLRGRVTYTRRIMTGGKKIAAEIPVYFNEAYHFTCNTITGREFRVITRNTGDDWAKTALPVPDEIDFTNKSLFDEIQGYIKRFKEENPDLFKSEIENDTEAQSSI